MTKVLPSFPLFLGSTLRDPFRSSWWNRRSWEKGKRKVGGGEENFGSQKWVGGRRNKLEGLSPNFGQKRHSWSIFLILLGECSWNISSWKLLSLSSVSLNCERTRVKGYGEKEEEGRIGDRQESLGGALSRDTTVRTGKEPFLFPHTEQEEGSIGRSPSDIDDCS